MKVIKLGENDAASFDDYINNNNTFVKFYMIGCGHCESMKQDWNNMEEILEKDYDGDHIILDVNSDLLSKSTHNIARTITGFPTIIEIKKGGEKGHEYNGDRTVDNLIDFCTQKLNIRKKTPAMSGGGKVNKIKKNMRKNKKLNASNKKKYNMRKRRRQQNTKKSKGRSYKKKYNTRKYRRRNIKKNEELTNVPLVVIEWRN